MKTLVKNGVSLMVLKDDTPVKIGAVVEIGDPVRVRIDNNDRLIMLYENVVPPENYLGKRYCFDGEQWSYNFNWRDPKLTAAKR